MFDIGWSEMAVIAVVALIVIGPKDLPKLLFTAGKMAAKARATLHEFQQGIAEMGREAELEELRNKIEAARDFNPERELTKALDPTGEVRDALDPTMPDEPSVRNALDAPETSARAGTQDPEALADLDEVAGPPRQTVGEPPPDSGRERTPS